METKNTEYWELSAVYEGFLDEVMDCFDEREAQSHVDRLIHKYQDFQGTAEVYVTYHAHPFGLDCECGQYLTDHHPYWTNHAEDE